MGEIQTLSRAFDILFAISDAGRTLSVEEISIRTEIPESTAYRLLQTLGKKGFIERKEKNQIGLGLKILELARSLNHEVDRELCIAAGPVMEKLTQKIGETSILMVRTGANVICIKTVPCDKLIRFVTENGRLLPLHVSASGKAILAFERNVIIEQVINNLDTDRDKKKLMGTLENIRKLGYSLTYGEADKDVLGIAAPIYDCYGRILASITLAGPTTRLQNEKVSLVIREVVNAAESISDRLKELSGL